MATPSPLHPLSPLSQMDVMLKPPPTQPVRQKKLAGNFLFPQHSFLPYCQNLDGFLSCSSANSRSSAFRRAMDAQTLEVARHKLATLAKAKADSKMTKEP